MLAILDATEIIQIGPYYVPSLTVSPSYSMEPLNHWIIVPILIFIILILLPLMYILVNKYKNNGVISRKEHETDPESLIIDGKVISN